MSLPWDVSPSTLRAPPAAALIKGHAKYLGITADEYVQKHIKSIERGGEVIG